MLCNIMTCDTHLCKPNSHVMLMYDVTMQMGIAKCILKYTQQVNKHRDSTIVACNQRDVPPCEVKIYIQLIYSDRFFYFQNYILINSHSPTKMLIKFVNNLFGANILQHIDDFTCSIHFRPNFKEALYPPAGGSKTKRNKEI